MRQRWLIIGFALLVLVVGGLTAGCASSGEPVTPRSGATDTPVEPTPTPSGTPIRPLRESTVAVAPASGPPGTELQIVGAGFPPETEIELALGRRGGDYDAVTTVSSNADGLLTTTLAIPMSAEPEEAWVVQATTPDEAMTTFSNPFQVTAPAYESVVSIAPSSGSPGTEVDVVAEGFPPGAPVEVGIGRENSEYDVVETMQTTDEGDLATEVLIPTFAEPGERWVVVITTEDRSVQGVSDVFEVMQPTYQGTVAISPRSGPPGTEVNVVARGFPPNAAVEIGVGRVSSEYDVVTTAQTDGNGRVDADITMPAFVDLDDRWVIVVAAESQAVKAVSDTFDVTRAATPTPTGEDRFSRATIYLIAVGDQGRSGKEIGCGDSVVAVDVAIEPTIAPLTAALNELLGIETREYGQSGLYNALYRSELKLEDVRIQDGEAVIRLRGDLRVGGVCDEPRVRAQLRQTALQYATVDRVSIFVNGRPLGELLGGN